MKSKKSNVWSVLGILCGIAMIVFGIVVLSVDKGYTSDSSAAFGADFYTYVFRAAARTANNVKALIDVFKLGMGFLLLGFGLTDVCLFGSKIVKNKKEEEKAGTAQTEEIENKEE